MPADNEERITAAEPRFLILETSGRVGFVAVATGSQLGEVRRLEESRRHARDLAPAVAALCKARGWSPRDIDGVIVSLGPGSYTGLRVGIMSAKTFAYATGCAIIGVETFAAVARQAPPEATRLDVIADAQQRKVYVQRWQRSGSAWQAESALTIKPISEWFDSLAPDIWTSGPGLRLYEADLPGAQPKVSLEFRDPQPESLLQTGIERWRARTFDDVWKIEPIYLRPSNAEENWDRLRYSQTRGQGDKGTRG